MKIELKLLFLNFILQFRPFQSMKEAFSQLAHRLNMLDKPYDEQYFNELKNECIFSKLDWHKKYKENCKGQETFYTAITSGIH